MKVVLCQLALYFEIAILGRAVLSWFPIHGGGVMDKLNRFLITITEPVMSPVRRILPRTGMFDLSPIIVLLVIQIVLRNIILGCTP